jgi:hypothetical protein
MPDLAEAPGPDALIAALRATGASMGEALGLTARALGPEAMRSQFDKAMRRSRFNWMGSGGAVAVLKAIAVNNPDLARWGLNRWLEGRFLKVSGNLDLNGETWVNALPDSLLVGGNLDLQDTGLTTVPEGLVVLGNLNLAGLPIGDIPAGTRVGGNLNLAWTKIRALPRGLVVGGALEVAYTALTVLPDDLKVGGFLELIRHPILATPKNLKVAGYLGLQGTPLRTLGQGLCVGSDCFLDGCPDWDGRIPEDAQIDGVIFTDRHPSPGIRLGAWRRLHPRGERP